MKTRFFHGLGIAGVLIFGACSSAGDNTAKQKKESNAASNGAAVALSNGDSVPGPQPADGNVVAAANGSNITNPVNSVQQKLNAMRKTGTGPDVDPAEIAAKNARPAPDNSTFTSYLTDAGYEIRTFKDHPQLLKVEKKIGADGVQTMKIFLRNGKVVELPGDKINPLSTARASFILDIAGLQTPPARQQQAPADVKKPGS